ncbi:MAG TPA: hypothetical protein PLX23_09450 [Candidatus Hydrogenedens sp.]|nr:hypothetical protein [Candidatus Hydrogenedens sp.]
MCYCKNFTIIALNFAILLLFLGFSGSIANSQCLDLRASPNEITFHDLDQEVSVKITYKNQPLKKVEIKNWSFLAGDNKYNHMITLKVMDGDIVVKPALLEVGTYDLIIETTYGKCLISVYAPLDKLSDTLENRARREGISVQKLKRRLGLVSPVHRVNINLEVPGLYYEGQTLEINLGKNPKHVYVWRVNGQVIKQGKGKAIFTYTFPEPGDYVIEVEERDADILLGKASASTKVISYEPLYYTVRMKQLLKLAAAEGYTSYTWKIDGVVQDEKTNTITLKFNAEKKYLVECIAKGPREGHPQSFFRTIYEITVTR